MIVVAQEAIWLRHILKEIGYEHVGPSLIYSNTQSAIILAKIPMFHWKIKYIKIKSHFIKEKVLDGTL